MGKLSDSVIVEVELVTNVEVEVEMIDPIIIMDVEFAQARLVEVPLRTAVLLESEI